MIYLKKYVKFNDNFVYIWTEIKDIREIVTELLIRTSDDGYNILINYDQDKNEVSININKDNYSTYWKYIKEDILRFIYIFNDYYDKHDEMHYIFLVKYIKNIINDDEIKNLSDDFTFNRLTIVLKFNNDYSQSLWLKNNK